MAQSVALFKDVAGEYVQMATEPSQVRHIIDRAFRIAKAERTVTCIIFPNDLQDLDYDEPAHQHGTVHSGMGYLQPDIIPAAGDLQKAADLLNSGEKVAMLIGAGAVNAEDEIMQIADLLGAGVAKALLGKAMLPDDLPYVTGSIGLLGTKPSYDLMMECDTLLMVGTSFPYSEFLPKEGHAKAVQIDIDGKMLGIRYPTEVNLQGDSKKTLQALIPLLKRKENRDWQHNIIREVERWWKVIDARAMNSADPINPQRVFRELSKKLPDNCILTADSGSSASWYARDIKMKRGMMASLSGNLATMCSGVSYAIAAKMAHPNRMVIAIAGDGAMQMMGINEMITIQKYWKRWSDPRLIILVLNNRDLNMVTWEQRVLAGDPKFEASQDLPDFKYAEYARMLDLDGIRVDNPEQIVPALDNAMNADRPFVLDVVTDPNVPPLPPHISLKQAKAFSSSLLKSDENVWDILKKTYKEVMDSYFTH